MKSSRGAEGEHRNTCLWQSGHCALVLIFLSFLITACSGPAIQPEESPVQVPVEPVPSAPDPYRNIPEFSQLAKALEQTGREYGLQFFRNGNGMPLLYSASTRNSFTIADRTGNCLYELRLLPEDTRRRRSGDDPTLPLLDLMPGPCGLSFPDIDPTVRQAVSEMEATVVSPAILGRLDAAPRLADCSPEAMIQEILPLPYRVRALNGSVEEWLWRNAELLTDPFDLSFGDMVAFDENEDPTRIGIYTGHGLVVYHQSCDTVGIHRMGNQFTYRAYRLFTGFAWSGHVLAEAELLKRYLSGTHGQTIEP